MASTVAAPPYTDRQATEYSNTGIWSWLTTVDHKRIGVLYLVSALIFFIVGGLEAAILRAQLTTPNGTARFGGHVQPAVHDAWHDDDLPRGHAAVGRVLQPAHPAADRRARRRVPAPQRVQLLGVPARRPVHHVPDLLRRRAGWRLVRLRAAQHEAVLAPDQHGFLGAGPADPRRVVAGGSDSTSSRPSSTCVRRACRSCACRSSRGWRSSCSSWWRWRSR